MKTIQGPMSSTFPLPYLAREVSCRGVSESFGVLRAEVWEGEGFRATIIGILVRIRKNSIRVDFPVLCAFLACTFRVQGVSWFIV